jgi:hypothetical protein
MGYLVDAVREGGSPKANCQDCVVQRMEVRGPSVNPKCFLGPRRRKRRLRCGGCGGRKRVGGCVYIGLGYRRRMVWGAKESRSPKRKLMMYSVHP